MSLQGQYHQKVALGFQNEFPNTLAVPKLMKIVVSVGLNRNRTDDALTRESVENIRRITGQQPVLTKAKKSIASFKIREGQVVGIQATLRGKQMYDFFEKLVGAALPRVRDFRGIDPRSVDASGNCSIGFREHIAFPEIRSDEVEKVHGLAVVIHTNAGDREKGMKLLKLLGVPFREGE